MVKGNKGRETESDEREMVSGQQETASDEWEMGSGQRETASEVSSECV